MGVVAAAGMGVAVGMAEVVVGTAEVVGTAGAVVFMDLLSTVAVVMAGVAMHRVLTASRTASMVMDLAAAP